MSRIGLKPITVPAGVEVTVDDNNLVTVKGPKGELTQKVASFLTVDIDGSVINVSRPSDDKVVKSQHGLARTLINNMVVGVSEGFQKTLKVSGVGYNVQKQGDKLVMKLGFSHLVEMVDPTGITTECPNNTTIIVKGYDKAFVGDYAAKIRAWRPPEPYKGKGITYEGEVVRKKEGKSR